MTRRPERMLSCCARNTVPVYWVDVIDGTMQLSVTGQVVAEKWE